MIFHQVNQWRWDWGTLLNKTLRTEESFLLVALVVKIRWQSCWEEELKVADCSLHRDIEWTKEGSPLIQHLLSGRLWKVPAWTPSTWQGCHWNQIRQMKSSKCVKSIEIHTLSPPGQLGEEFYAALLCVFCVNSAGHFRSTPPAWGFQIHSRTWRNSHFPLRILHRVWGLSHSGASAADYKSLSLLAETGNSRTRQI